MKTRLVFLTSVAMLFILVSAAQALIIVEPDNFSNGEDISVAFPGVTLSAFSKHPEFGFPLSDNRIIARSATEPGVVADTGTMVFGNTGSEFSEQWFSGDHMFRADFTLPANFVSIRAAANDDFDPAMAQIFNNKNVLLDTFTTLGSKGSGVYETISFNRSAFDIAYMIIGNPDFHPGESFSLDNMAFNPVPEPSAGFFLGFGLLILTGFKRLFPAEIKKPVTNYRSRNFCNLL